MENKVTWLSCPYCSASESVGISDQVYQCMACSKEFYSGVSDGNQHSLSEVSDKFSASLRLGELMEKTYRKGFQHCDKCGTIYSRKENVCPTFLETVLHAYQWPQSVMEGSSFGSRSEVRESIDSYLVDKLGKSAKELMK